MCEHTGEACKNKVFFHYLRYKCLSLSEFSSSSSPGCNEGQRHSAQSEGHCKKNFIDNRRFATHHEHLDLQRNVQNAEQTINIANCFKTWVREMVQNGGAARGIGKERTGDTETGGTGGTGGT